MEFYMEYFQVQNAQNANFSAVIIYNFDDQLLSMGSSAKGERKTVTFTILLFEFRYSNTGDINYSYQWFDIDFTLFVQ